jgi:hypothetical protein
MELWAELDEKKNSSNTVDINAPTYPKTPTFSNKYLAYIPDTYVRDRERKEKSGKEKLAESVNAQSQNVQLVGGRSQSILPHFNCNIILHERWNAILQFQQSLGKNVNCAILNLN